MKLPTRKTDGYHDYAAFYDELKGDRSDKIRLLLDIIAKHRPESRAVIELACGTGTIVQGLAGIYDITGLDISKAMLRQAQKRLPHTPLILADMTNFQVPRTFDVAYCFHNSVRSTAHTPIIDL
jgi:ubiquinone/menaquinone biosynthesis C-methylase UbiE